MTIETERANTSAADPNADAAPSPEQSQEPAVSDADPSDAPDPAEPGEKPPDAQASQPDADPGESPQANAGSADSPAPSPGGAQQPRRAGPRRAGKSGEATPPVIPPKTRPTPRSKPGKTASTAKPAGSAVPAPARRTMADRIAESERADDQGDGPEIEALVEVDEVQGDDVRIEEIRIDEVHVVPEVEPEREPEPVRGSEVDRQPEGDREVDQEPERGAERGAEREAEAKPKRRSQREPQGEVRPAGEPDPDPEPEPESESEDEPEAGGGVGADFGALWVEGGLASAAPEPPEDPFAAVIGSEDADALAVAGPAGDDLGPVRPDFVRMVVDGVPIADGGPTTRVVPAAKAAQAAPRRAGGRPKAVTGALAPPGAPVPVGGAAGSVVIPAPAPVAVPDPAAQAPARPAGAPHRVKVQIGQISPWSVMKLAFLLSVGLGVAFVVLVFIVWNVLDRNHFFVDINEQITAIVGQEGAARFDILQYVDKGKVMAGATAIAVINIVLATALATLGTLLYNVTSALVGGIHVTLRDD
jgi:hypothetical protein